ncbi:hypothetical protein BGZ95_011851 [Linnemannia exigua]|uniref:Thioredoxin domain-containing protein n=1 Tax=Linnemannia exigua TaxID=604196 RepID=A0AAD4D9K6_9FUNG|nr:hypothetical protein BGZ95_011851 [Linnemannia exigua]
MFVRGILSAALAIAACSSFQAVDASVASKSLTYSTFEAAIENGATFVKYYSPECVHSQKLAPTWEKLAVDRKDWQRTVGFKFAEVDCVAEADLCEENEVVSYPTMKLYHRGHQVAKFANARTYESLDDFASAMASEYIEVPEGIKPEEIGEVRVNALGKVVSLTPETYKSRTPFGPWLVEYYAPWCGHCQALAPVWDELAEHLKDKVNVAKVDCTVNQEICYRQRIRGYPTIKLHQFGETIEYEGFRSGPAFAEFALEAIVPSVKPITLEDLNNVKGAKDVTFIYTNDDKTSAEVNALIDRQSQIFYRQIDLYGSNDPTIAKSLGVSSPSLTVLKDNRQYTYQGSLTDAEAVRAWIKKVKEPLVLSLDGSNIGTFLQTKGWIALGLFDPSQADATAEARKELIEAAHAYYGAKAESHDVLGAPLNFAILDAQQWLSYVRGAFGLEKDALPAVFVVNGVQEQYYAHGFDGRRVTITKDALLAHIADIEAGLLTPKSQVGLVQKGFREFQKRTRFIHIFYQKHPTVALTIAAAMVLAMMRRMSPKVDPNAEAAKEGAEKEGKEIKQD